jgi:hypothetical protein
MARTYIAFAAPWPFELCTIDCMHVFLGRMGIYP